MFTAALLTIANPWKQSRCPTTDKWIKKMWHLYTMEFHLAIKKNENLSFSRKWVELENIILSEISQAQKAKNHIFSHMWNIDQLQIQQCYEKHVTLRGYRIQEGKGKRRKLRR
jgi:hypothetical protein